MALEDDMDSKRVCGECEYFDIEDGESVCGIGGGYCDADDDICDAFVEYVATEDYDDGTD